ncbi:GC-rich sequence DNA-binding factor 2 isoform X2 [Syngnathoides biaculeatus]|uniref:GC-rich sequence DNA-binding factor 2 isoform X2 n=1 Tax=Syngnathoides biaculeatus TaxID=300417 RepID=UPI002ADD3249|nr:GC-rich sequence DNA-binding factor 2 isoform X2 [Syngnathoides biaculeatus]
MFRKKPRRVFRQRKEESSDEEETVVDRSDEAGSEKTAILACKPSRVGHSRGISCSSKREATPSKVDDAVGEDVEISERTIDTDENLKDNYDKTRTSTVLSFSDDKESLEPEFKLRKSADKAVLFQIRKKETLPVKDNYNNEPERILSSGSPREDDDSQASSHSSHQSDYDEVENDEDEDEDKDVASSSSSSSKCSYSAVKPVVIPNAKAIKAAKMQRCNIRAQKEFIPLNTGGRTSSGSTPERYHNEEMEDDDDEDRVEGGDDDDEPDNHEKRIEFAPGLKSVKERIVEELGGTSVGSLSGSDEEEQELWEETQIGKGVKRCLGRLSPSGSESSSYSSSSFQHNERQRQKKSTGLKIPKTLPSVTVSMVKRRIASKLDSLKEVHSVRRAELSRMEGDSESAKTSVESLEESSSEKQLKFYRDMTIFSHNLVECLREKIVEINSLELELHTLLSSQMEALCAQRRQNMQEHAQHLQQLSYNSNNGGKTQSVAATGDNTVEDCDIPEDTQPSSEEEELKKEMAAILLKSQRIFSDVHDDFYDVKMILTRFEEWRSFYSDSYHSAYISLCLPKLLNPIIRHQLLGWNPLKDTSMDFEKLPWFTAVESFCHGHSHEELHHLDREMLSNVIERTVIPKITAFVELVWDPMSLHQSARLTGLCHQLREDYSIFEGEQSKPVTTLIKAVIGRLRRCVDEDVFIPLYPKKLLEDSLSPQSRFRNQQFWIAIKLLGNMGKWDPLLPDSELKELILDKLLCRYLTITLSSQKESKNDLPACKKIAESLPTSWFRGENECLPQLQTFKNHLVQKAHSICKQQPPDTRLALIEVLKILSRIRCHDSIMSIAEKYHYEDVIYSHQLLNQETQ